MKIWLNIVCALFLFCQRGLSQDFVNLNFEQSLIVTNSQDGFSEAIGHVSGWAEYYGWDDTNYAGGMAIVYNNAPLDLAGVSLVGTNYGLNPAIQGKYSVLLYGGTSIPQDGTNGAAIGQTGQIPLSAQSITYWGYGPPLQVTFNGQLLSFMDISNADGYAVFSADISAYAGQTGELLFAATWPASGAPDSYDMLDNIQFSTSPVPEPDIFSLCALGNLFLALGAWKPIRRHSFSRLSGS